MVYYFRGPMPLHEHCGILDYVGRLARLDGRGLSDVQLLYIKGIETMSQK